jgi:hypothetical protein
MADEEILLGRLQEAFDAVDPIPEYVHTAGLAAFAWRSPDAALAELITDSAESAPAGVRGQGGLGRGDGPDDGDPRLLVFTGPDVAVEIEVSGHGTDREIVGRLDPAAAARIAVRHQGGVLAARADQAGHFVVSAVPAGPVSLVFLLADATSVVTSWVRL